MTTLKPGDRVLYDAYPSPLTVHEVRDHCDEGPDCPLGQEVFRYDDGDEPDWLHASKARKVGR
jgi:hypothetical protein